MIITQYATHTYFIEDLKSVELKFHCDQKWVVQILSQR